MTINGFNLFCILIISTALPVQTPLQQYFWKNRIVIIYSDNSELSKQQLLTTQSDSVGWADRDIVIFQMFKNHSIAPTGDTLKPNDHQWLRNNYLFDDPDFQFLLIGKDSGIKLKSNKPVGNSRLFALIDGMPMRKQEMKKRQ